MVDFEETGRIAVGYCTTMVVVEQDGPACGWRDGGLVSDVGILGDMNGITGDGFGSSWSDQATVDRGFVAGVAFVCRDLVRG